MRTARFILMTAMLASLGGCASIAAPSTPVAKLQAPAAFVPAPHWRVGSSWEYSDGYAIEVAWNEDGATVFQRVDAPGQWFSMRGFLRQDAGSRSQKRQTIYRTVAPDAGDELSSSQPLTFQREYLSDDKLMVHATSWTVEGRQQITVPAGTFDCWLIVWRARSLKSDWTGFERWWYSPEAQQYVRLEYKYGDGPTASRVLMRYRLAKPEEASAPSISPIAPAAPPKPARAADRNIEAAPDLSDEARNVVQPVPVATKVLIAFVAPLPLTQIAIADSTPETTTMHRAQQKWGSHLVDFFSSAVERLLSPSAPSGSDAPPAPASKPAIVDPSDRFAGLFRPR
jgi:hypothetical protein